MLTLNRRNLGGAAVIDVAGNLMGEPDATTFRECVKAVLEDGHRRVVINLFNVKWANSLGLGMLIGALTRVREAGGEIALAHVCDRIERVFATTRLNRIFHAFGSEADAIRFLLGDNTAAGVEVSTLADHPPRVPSIELPGL